jgi:hypothetical protein
MLARAMDEALIFADDGSICVSGEINVSAEVEKHMRSLHWTYDSEIKSWCAPVHG